MRPAPFDLVRPTTVDAALEALDDDGSRPLAGGQSLIALMNLRLAAPSRLVDLGLIPELADVSRRDGAVHIGAMARQAAAEAHPLVREHAPLVAEGLSHVGHWQIRCRGTVGGNLAHSDPASELPAVMLALDATYHARDRQGSRAIPAAGFQTGPYENALGEEELLTSVEVPSLAPGEGSALVEISRVAGAYAMAGAAVTCQIEDGVCRRARIAVFASGSQPSRIPEAEAEVAGRPIGDAVLDAVAEATTSTITAHEDVHATAEQRRHLIGVSAARALAKAAARSSGAQS